MGYQCAADDGNQAFVLLTNLDNGDTVAWCQEHYGPFLVSALESMGTTVGSDPGDFLARVKAVAVQQLGAVGGMTASKPVKAARVEQIHAMADAIAATYADEPGYESDRTIAQVIETGPTDTDREPEADPDKEVADALAHGLVLPGVDPDEPDW